MIKNRLERIISCFLTVLILFAGISPLCAEASAQDAENIFEEIIEYNLEKSGADNIQQWIDGELTKKAGASSEWYIIALSQCGEYDFSAYEKALLGYLEKNQIYSASSRQKYAVALIGIGSSDGYIYNTLNDSIGQQGVMSWIYGLHLLNNGYESEAYTLKEVKEKLLSLQLSDGGWAVMGSSGDVDVTAMAVQALAPYYKSDSAVKKAVDSSLSFLSDIQQEDGDFKSRGQGNSESTAQVITALSSLGIDCETDSRFIKNSNTLFDGIKKYRLSDGSFCHSIGGGYNENATVQVFYTMVSYIRMKNGQTGLYILDKRNPSKLKIPQVAVPDEKGKTTSISVKENASTKTTSVKGNSSAGSTVTTSAGTKATDTPKTAVTTTVSEKASSTVTTEAGSYTVDSSTSDSPETSSLGGSVTSVTSVGSEKATTTKTEKKADEDKSENNSENKRGGYKPWVCLGIIFAAGGVCAVLFFTKKRKAKNFILVAVTAGIAVLIVLATDFQPPEEYYKASQNAEENAVGKVFITIRCDTIKDKSSEYVPDDGIILETTEVEIGEDETVYDVLLDVTKENKIHLETSGSSVYVQGIANIYEFDFGDLSGWMYFVNGESPSVSCSEYVVSDGDEIEWLYTCELGEDL